MKKNLYIKYVKSNEESYAYQISNSIKLDIVGSFLIHDCYYGIKGYKEGILSDECLGLTGNLTFIEKEGDHVILSDHFSEQPDGGPYFKIPKDEFLRLLDMWEKVYKEKPQEITIIYDGQKFSIETK